MPSSSFIVSCLARFCKSTNGPSFPTTYITHAYWFWSLIWEKIKINEANLLLRSSFDVAKKRQLFLPSRSLFRFYFCSSSTTTKNMQTTSQSLTDCLLNVKFSHKLSTFRSFEWTCLVAECVGAEQGRHKCLYPGHVFLKCKSNCHHLRDGKEDGGGFSKEWNICFSFYF